ncbi:MAG: OmpA family protein [Rhodospirillales bacterium]|nr:OmpA family protein [Rhodospirillales bacterium]
MLKPLSTKTTAVTLILLLGACAAPTEPLNTGTLSDAEAQVYHEAIAHFEQLISEKPGEIEAVLGLARNLRWSGQTAKAQAVLESARAQFVTDGRYLAELGKVELILGHSASGAALLEDAAAKIGTDWRLYSALGIAQDYQENYVLAEAAYRKALDLCPNDAAVMNNLGISQALSGNLDRAILTLEEALERQDYAAKIEQNLKLFKDARDLCASCGAQYVKQGGSQILSAGLMGTDQEGPCTPHPQYTEKRPEMVKSLVESPSINIKVYFEFDSAILKPESLDVLDSLGAALTSGELSGHRFELAGHTDAVGSEAYNFKLSERRAKAVLEYLSAQFDIDASRIDTVGYGESRLLDSDNPEGDVNRRVQVTRLNAAN